MLINRLIIFYRIILSWGGAAVPPWYREQKFDLETSGYDHTLLSFLNNIISGGFRLKYLLYDYSGVNYSIILMERQNHLLKI
jgi:hypothetical protein